MFKVGISYSEVTPESAKHGDFSDTGWDREPEDNWSLTDFLREVENQGYEHISGYGSSIDIYGSFYTDCYQTGTERQTCIHVSGPERQIKRLIKILENR